MKRILILFTFLFSFLTFGMEIHLGVESSWAPYADEHGEGISTDIVVKAFEEVGVKVKLHVYPYSRIMEMTKRGELDGCFSIPKDKNTKKDFLFGDEPILETTASYYYLRGSLYKDKLLKGDKVALMRGFQYGDKYDLKKSLVSEVRVNTQEQILKLILKSRADVGILADESAKFHIEKLKLGNQIMKGGILSSFKFYLAFPKDKSLSVELADLLDKGIRSLKEKGIYKNLLTGNNKGQASMARID